MTPIDIIRVIALGWHVVPRLPRTRACPKGVAHAMATDDCVQVSAWATAYPDCGWYVVCGPSRIWALDVDAPGPDRLTDGIATLRDLTARHGPLPAGPRIRTGGNGWALIYRDGGAPLAGRSGALGPGLDPRRGTQSLTLPPTLHHRTGQPYRWHTAPWDVPPPPAPLWMVAALTPTPTPAPKAARPIRASHRYVQAMVDRFVTAVATAPAGSANDTLNRAAYALGRCVGAGLLSPADVAAVLMDAARHRSVPVREAAATIRSGIRGGQAKPLTVVDGER